MESANLIYYRTTHFSFEIKYFVEDTWRLCKHPVSHQKLNTLIYLCLYGVMDSHFIQWVKIIILISECLKFVLEEPSHSVSCVVWHVHDNI